MSKLNHHVIWKKIHVFLINTNLHIMRKVDHFKRNSILDDLTIDKGFALWSYKQWNIFQVFTFIFLCIVYVCVWFIIWCIYHRKKRKDGCFSKDLNGLINFMIHHYFQKDCEFISGQIIDPLLLHWFFCCSCNIINKNISY